MKRKERLFPYWGNVKRVIAVLQSQAVAGIALTLVSIEMYERGFLLTMNFESNTPNPMFNRVWRGWFRATAVDAEGNPYLSLLATAHGQTYKSLFTGRAVVVCMPQLTADHGVLSITVDKIEWEYLDSNEQSLPFEVLVGPWEFEVAV